MRVLEQRMDDLTKKLEEPDRRLAFLEEQRRTDARRLSEIETELPEQKKQMDTIRPKLTLIEDLTIRNERRIQEFANGERERREQIQQFIDQQQLVMQQRDQQVGDLFKRFAQHDEEMSKNIERFELWEQTHREMKRVIDDFNRIGDRLERRINEVAEMQRLSEERFRQEWNDWRDDDQKRWKQLTLSNDEVWRNHDREFETYVKRLDGIEGTVPSVRESVDRLWQLERARADLYRDR
jgi:chromosome segregation ATPase